MTVNLAHLQYRLFIRWVFACTLGMLAGFALSYAAVIIAQALVERVNEDRLLGAIMFEALALMSTVAQWWVLRKEIERSTLWFPASIAGWLVLMVLAAYLGRQGLFATDKAAGRSLLAGIAGLVLGIAQWLPLRKSFRWASIWIFGSVVGWSMLPLVIEQSIYSIFQMALLGAIPAISTGVVLVLLKAQVSAKGEALAA